MSEKEIQDGTRAEYLMDEMRPYFDMLRDAIIKQWESCPVRDKDGQNELKLMRKLLNDLEGNIKTVVDTGKLAKVQIERENKWFR